MVSWLAWRCVAVGLKMAREWEGLIVSQCKSVWTYAVVGALAGWWGAGRKGLCGDLLWFRRVVRRLGAVWKPWQVRGVRGVGACCHRCAQVQRHAEKLCARVAARFTCSTAAGRAD